MFVKYIEANKCSWYSIEKQERSFGRRGAIMLKYSSYQSIYTLPTSASQNKTQSKFSNKVAKLNKFKGFKKIWQVFAITILFMLICTVAVKAFESPNIDNNKANENNMVIVQAGDTLWQLATHYKPEKWDTRAFIQVIQRENKLESSVIRAGEVISIPIMD